MALTVTGLGRPGRIPGGLRRATGQYRGTCPGYSGGCPPRAPETAVIYGVWPGTGVADCAYVCVQLDPVRHRLIAWTKLLMIAVPWMVRIDSG
jgi:hypothetical protein